MQISRVKLSGFKSFVDPAELRILPGLTGIVGPNGCGKSNLLEAIRWAMGEGSAKSLRGAGMEDVIFAGTATRPQRQFAEVSILAERDTEEVEVVRRIERGAGSAWRINGRDVRARDAQLLFADAATGAHSPALVSQGRIGAVIAAKPAERRAMLEEAAGIAGLHVRRREAEIRLKATETNLARIAELVADMEGRAASLRRQARAAERYRALSDAIRVSEGRLIFARWRDAAEAADAARAEARAAEANVAVAAEAQRVAAALAVDGTERRDAARDVAQSARDTASDARHALASAEAALRAAEARVLALAEERARLESDREREGDLAQDAGEALARLKEEAAALNAGIAAAVPGRADLLDRVADAEQAAREAELAHARATAEAAQRDAELRVAEAALAAARTRSERCERDHARAIAEAAGLTPLVQIEADHQRAVAVRDMALAARDAAVAGLGEAQAAQEAANAAHGPAQAARSAAGASLATLESELRSLASAREDKGALAAVRAASGYEAALAAALAEDLTADIGAESRAERRWAGTAIDAIDPVLQAGPALAAYVDAPAELARRLAQIAVVDRDDGQTLAVGQRLVTRDGRMRRWDGFCVDRAGAAEAERLIRRNRRAELETLVPKAQAEVDRAEADLRAARDAVSASNRAIAEARTAREQAEGALRSALRGVDVASAELDRAAANHTRLVVRIEEAARDRDAARAELARAEGARALLPAAGDGGALAAVAAAANEARENVVAARTELGGFDAALNAQRARQAAVTAEAESWRARSGKAGRRVEDITRRTAALDAEAITLVDAPAEAKARVAQLAEATRRASELAEATLIADREADALARSRDAAAAQAGEALASARETRAGAAARAEHQEARRIEMNRISGERFECPPPLLPGKLGFEAASTGTAQAESAKHDALTVDRERLGPVNLVAEAELREMEESRATAAAEMAELTEATHRLRGSIGSLNREGRARLRAAFDTVDAHFRILFSTLFNGGEAHLAMIDSDDPLEAGLEILAQPPGKKLSSLTLLSGGEQALTAVALIFALFLTNPAPLCVLDEVDAPLDDANVERFCDLLDAMSRDTDTRYLIVTHNAVTMSRMHRLYGVTMVERGISRLVSVDLGGAEELLAAE